MYNSILIIVSYHLQTIKLCSSKTFGRLRSSCFRGWIQVIYGCIRSLVSSRSRGYERILGGLPVEVAVRCRGLRDLSSTFSQEFFSISIFCPLRPYFAKAADLRRNRSACKACLRCHLFFLAQFRDEC